MASVKLAALAVSLSEITQIRWNYSTIKHKSRCSADVRLICSLSAWNEGTSQNCEIQIEFSFTRRTHTASMMMARKRRICLLLCSLLFLFLPQITIFFLLRATSLSHTKPIFILQKKKKKRRSNQKITRDGKTIHTDREDKCPKRGNHAPMRYDTTKPCTVRPWMYNIHCIWLSLVFIWLGIGIIKPNITLSVSKEAN